MNKQTIESQIGQLKELVKKYDSLSDLEKINQIDQYKEAKENHTLCKNKLDEYVNSLESIKDIDSENSNDTEISINDIMEQIKIIKEQTDANSNLDELMNLYTKLTNFKTILQSYLENKKMEIINVE